MKPISFLVLILLFCAFTCEDREDTDVVLEGTFSGQFTRIDPAALFAPSDVTLTFQDGSFEGTSSVSKYPAICRGTYSVSGNTVTFANSCYWTAEFDWTFILNGEFAIEKHKDGFRLTRSYGGAVSDVYMLSVPED